MNAIRLKFAHQKTARKHFVIDFKEKQGDGLMVSQTRICTSESTAHIKQKEFSLPIYL